MARKVLIGMIAVFIGIGIASVGYKFGRYLAQMDSPQPLPRSTAPA